LLLSQEAKHPRNTAAHSGIPSNPICWGAISAGCKQIQASFIILSWNKKDACVKKKAFFFKNALDLFLLLLRKLSTLQRV
jgi:hypothetical protein